MYELHGVFIEGVNSQQVRYSGNELLNWHCTAPAKQWQVYATAVQELLHET
jgi:hypothetical protein